MSNPRIITGIYKSRTLKVPDSARPITDRVKMQLFDIVSDYVDGAKVLDLYAGSGNIGIEALSRGASHVTFVENNYEALNLIEENLSSLEIPNDQYEVINSDVKKYLNRVEKKFDLIFVDPPFKLHSHIEIDNFKDLLAEDGLLCFKAASNAEIKPINELEEVYRKEVGVNVLLFYKLATSH